MTPDFSPYQKEHTLAVAVSGGPDSMALLHMLSQWSESCKGPDIAAFTVDHGLRAGSAAEARQVAGEVKSWPRVTHKILRWAGRKPASRIMETARAARYELLAAACKKKRIRHLFLAHHQDDQAETLLYRLARGSGLDGLAGMKPGQEMGDVLLIRPLLGIGKTDLVAYAKKCRLAFIEDPSNLNETFARPRLRQAQAVLEREGLSSKRLAVTASRLARARQALDELAEKAWVESCTGKSRRDISFDHALLSLWPAEIRLRVVLAAMRTLAAAEDYGPRMEKVEALEADMFCVTPFRRRTLGGCVFSRMDKGRRLVIGLEGRG